jgi:GTPase SAR1 family protein
MRTFYKGASAVILTYDITDLTTFSDLDYWTKQISKLFIKYRGLQ